MLTYEDHPPGSVIEPKPLEHYEQWIGHSVIREFNVTILRDPFNFFASRIQAELNGTYSLECWGDCFSKGDSTKLWSKWKTYARRFLSFTASSSPDLIPISYNHWIKSIDYRKCICQDLNVTLINDEERKIVTGWGAGSSFNQGIWQEPEIYMNRWRAYIGHHVLAEAVRDEELVKLAREIFGDVIDVDFIVNSIEKLQ